MNKNQVKHRKLGFFVFTSVIIAFFITTSSANLYTSNISNLNNYEKKIDEVPKKNQLSFAAFARSSFFL